VVDFQNFEASRILRWNSEPCDVQGPHDMTLFDPLHGERICQAFEPLHIKEVFVDACGGGVGGGSCIWDQPIE
jgi:hypothetical protein